MALKINETKVVNDNIFKFEDILKSPSSKYQDVTQTYTTYFNINDNETTISEGFGDVHDIISKNSPIRFNEIRDLPILISDQILTQITENGFGLDSTYNGNAVIISGTIVPKENDMFIINHLKSIFIFRVTGVEIGLLVDDSTFNISFQLEYTDQEFLDLLRKQCVQKFICNYSNIGTDKKCIIESELSEEIKRVEDLYDNIRKTYMIIFYDPKYNSLLCHTEHGIRIYDPLLAMFVNEHGLLNDDSDYKTTILTEQFPDNSRILKYERSIYRYTEIRRPDRFNRFKYILYPANIEPLSDFARWYDESVMISSQSNKGDRQIVSDKMFEDFTNRDFSSYLGFMQIILKFFSNIDIKLEEFSEDLYEYLLDLSDDIELYVFTPIILYIMRYSINKELKK